MVLALGATWVWPCDGQKPPAGGTNAPGHQWGSCSPERVQAEPARRGAQSRPTGQEHGLREWEHRGWQQSGGGGGRLGGISGAEASKLGKWMTVELGLAEG